MFASLVLLSLLLGVATAVVAGLSFQQPRAYPVAWRGAEYGLELHDGRLSVGNMPQVRAEERERWSSLAELKRDFDERFDVQHVTLQRLRYGTPEYDDAKKGMDRLRADYEARRREIVAGPRLAAVKHSLPLWAVVLSSLPLPATWTVLWLARRPRLRRELRTPTGLLASLLLAINLAMAGLWAWSYFGGGAWTFEPTAIAPPITNWHARSWLLFRSVRMDRGQVQFLSKEIPLTRGDSINVRTGYEHGGGFIPVGRI